MIYDNLNEEEIKNIYSKLVESINDFEIDIQYSEKALEDPNVPYNEKPELRSDILYDKSQIYEKQLELHKLLDYCYLNNIIVDVKNK